jgi:hypothetical protein
MKNSVFANKQERKKLGVKQEIVPSEASTLKMYNSVCVSELKGVTLNCEFSDSKTKCKCYGKQKTFGISWSKPYKYQMGFGRFLQREKLWLPNQCDAKFC